MHYQQPPFAQGKLAGVQTGTVREIILIICEGSPTYGRSFSLDLVEEDPTKQWCPPGFLHGFATQRPDTRFRHEVTAPYSANHDRSVACNDLELGLIWGLGDPVLSENDMGAPPLAESRNPYPVGSLGEPT